MNRDSCSISILGTSYTVLFDVSEEWGKDETITDWIAIQFPKILEVFHELDCL